MRYRLAIVYFLLVFSAGFLLALVRIPVLEPMIGVRWSELVEMPLMLAVIWLVGQRLAPSLEHARDALACGALALLLLLLVEFTVVLALRGVTLANYLSSRDWLSGAAYAVSLIVFALMPWWQWRRLPRGGEGDEGS